MGSVTLGCFLGLAATFLGAGVGSGAVFSRAGAGSGAVTIAMGSVGLETGSACTSTLGSGLSSTLGCFFSGSDTGRAIAIARAVLVLLNCMSCCEVRGSKLWCKAAGS